jgi:hypothetical protein
MKQTATCLAYSSTLQMEAILLVLPTTACILFLDLDVGGDVTEAEVSC